MRSSEFISHRKRIKGYNENLRAREGNEASVVSKELGSNFCPAEAHDRDKFEKWPCSRILYPRFRVSSLFMIICQRDKNAGEFPPSSADQI